MAADGSSPGLLKSISNVGSMVASGAYSMTSNAIDSASTAFSPPKGDREPFTGVDVEAGKKREREEETPMAKITGIATEYYGVAAAWTEEHLSPRAVEYTKQAKELSGAAATQLKEEGILTKEAVLDAFNLSKTVVLSTSGKSILATVFGDLPSSLVTLINRIPNVEVPEPADAKEGFVTWNAAALSIGYFAAVTFAINHFFLDAHNGWLLYFLLYAVKLAFDLALSSLFAYCIYFTFLKSTNTSAQLAAMAFVGLVIASSALVVLGGWCDAAGTHALQPARDRQDGGRLPATRHAPRHVVGQPRRVV